MASKQLLNQVYKTISIRTWVRTNAERIETNIKDFQTLPEDKYLEKMSLAYAFNEVQDDEQIMKELYKRMK